MEIAFSDFGLLLFSLLVVLLQFFHHFIISVQCSVLKIILTRPIELQTHKDAFQKFLRQKRTKLFSLFFQFTATNREK